MKTKQSPSPNEARGNGHWIHYDLGHLYALGETQVWNLNDPDRLNHGAQQIAIDYSLDGEEWVELGTYDVAQGSGLGIYEGQQLVDFDGIEAEHVLLTVVSNYGGICTGISEVFFEVLGVISSTNEYISENACFDVQVFPNPHQSDFKARIKSECNERMTASLHDAMGRLIHSQEVGQAHGVNLVDFEQLALSPGVYYLRVEQGLAVGRYQVVRMK